MRERMTSGMFEKAKLMEELKKLVGKCETICIQTIWESWEGCAGLYKFVAVYADKSSKELPSKLVASLMNRVYDDESKTVYFRVAGDCNSSKYYLEKHFFDILEDLSPTKQIGAVFNPRTGKDEISEKPFHKWSSSMVSMEQLEEYKEDKERKERIRQIAEKNQAYLASFPCQFLGTYMRYATA